MNKFKIIAVVALVLAIIGIFRGTKIIREITNTRVLSGVTDFDELGLNKVVTTYQRFTIASATSTASWKNNTGEIVFLDYSEIYVPGKASSTMHLFMNVASSSADINSDITEFVLPNQSQSNIIFDARYATSTFGLRTSFNQPNLTLTGPTSATGTAPVLPGQFVVMSIMSDSATCDGTQAAGTIASNATRGHCDSATSTARGFNPIGLIRYHYYATTSPRL